MGDEEVKVVSFWASPFAMKVLIALREKSVSYSHHEENLQMKSELLVSSNPVHKKFPVFMKSELLVSSNPVHKKVPVLIHNGKAVSESNITLQYIDETWPGASSFMPSDPYHKAQARFWADFIDNKLIWEAGPFFIGSKEEEVHKEGRAKIIEYLGILENVLGDKKYFGGNEFGYVDIVFVPCFAWLEVYKVLGGLKFSMETMFPKLKLWGEKCMQRDSVKDVVPSPDKLVQHGFSVRKRILGES